MSPDLSDEAMSVFCPVAATLDLLNGKWTLHILRVLLNGRKRFNELSRAIGACSSRTLCHRLRALEEQGILVREVKTTIPPWVEYELTEKGRALNAVIDSIVQWGNTYMHEEVSRCDWKHDDGHGAQSVERPDRCSAQDSQH
jgi:DNA-binding HxlR family transcriptional regulator